jgi:hypothetical protein
MMRGVNSEKAVSLPTKLLLALALLLLVPFAVAQNRLGELLDAGAKKLSVDEFKQDVVQRTVGGPTASGEGNIEMMYGRNGLIQGTGTSVTLQWLPPLSGEWTTDADGRICASMRTYRGGGTPLSLPTRCQYWFKYKDDYFVVDSDSDRSARVLRRTVKQ